MAKRKVASEEKPDDGPPEFFPEYKLIFIETYLRTRNATKSAIAAGYPPKSAGSAGHYLLKDSDILKVIQARRNEHARRIKVSPDRLVKEIARMAFSDDSTYSKTIAMKMLGDHLGIFDGKGKADSDASDDDAERVLSAARKSEG